MPGTPRTTVRIEPYTEAHAYHPPSGGFSPGSNASTDTDSHSVDSNPRSENELTRKTSAGAIPTRNVSLLSGDRKPAYNPMQFVKVGPANLYQEAQKQMKLAEEVKVARNTKSWRDDEEDWQSNLTNWKTTRRKKVEPLIERVVEVKKYEEEAFDRENAGRRRKTFSEMMQERSEKGRTTRTSFDLSLYTNEEDSSGNQRRERHENGDDDAYEGEEGEDEEEEDEREENGCRPTKTNGSRSFEYDDAAQFGNGAGARRDFYRESLQHQVGDKWGRQSREEEGEQHQRQHQHQHRVGSGYDDDDEDASDEGGDDGGAIVGATSAVALMSKSVNDLTLERPNARGDDSGLGASMTKAPSTPQVWSAAGDNSVLREESREDSSLEHEEEEASTEDLNDSSESYERRDGYGGYEEAEALDGGRRGGDEASLGIRRDGRSDEEWRRIQELENNIIQQLEKEESERAKFAFGMSGPSDLVIDTEDLSYDDSGSLLLSPSSKEPPKEKPPPPPPTEPPPLNDDDDNDGGVDRRRGSEASRRVLPPQPPVQQQQQIQRQQPQQQLQQQKQAPMVEVEERQHSQQQQNYHKLHVSAPEGRPESVVTSKPKSPRELFFSAQPPAARPPSPPSVTIQTASGAPPGPIRSTSVSNRVKMWETGNFPRRAPEEEAEDDDGRKSSSSSRVDVPVPKETVREMYHNPGFARDSPLPQPSSSTTAWEDSRGAPITASQQAGVGNFYQNLAELQQQHPQPQVQPQVPVQAQMQVQVHPNQQQGNRGYTQVYSKQQGFAPTAGGGEAGVPPRSMSAAGFGSGPASGRQLGPQYSSHSDSSLRPRTEDGMWKAANGRNVQQQRYNPGGMPEPMMPNHSNGYQHWEGSIPDVGIGSGEDMMVKQHQQASRSRSVEDLPHHPHHVNHHSHLPPGQQQQQPQTQTQAHVQHQYKLPPIVPHQMQQRPRLQAAGGGVGAQYPQGVQRPNVQPPPPPMQVAAPPRGRQPYDLRQNFSHNGTVVYQSQHMSQPIYENLPPPQKRTVEPFHNGQMSGGRSAMPWQQPQVQAQPQMAPVAGQQQGVPDPRLGSGTPPMLSVSGKKKCSHCGRELGRGAAMIVESLRLFYHLECFRCCVCEAQLGNGKTGADVRVRNNRLHCHNCYSNEQGVKFSKV